jgi:hypothetical protein
LSFLSLSWQRHPFAASYGAVVFLLKPFIAPGAFAGLGLR